MVHNPMATYPQDGMDDLARGMGNPPGIYMDSRLVLGDIVVISDPFDGSFTLSSLGLQEVLDNLSE